MSQNWTTFAPEHPEFGTHDLINKYDLHIDNNINNIKHFTETQFDRVIMDPISPINKQIKTNIIYSNNIENISFEQGHLIDW